MSVVKVKPELYGTCRLCLEDMGQYLILPKIQDQIKYCFGISVEAFDGLPQLLCNKCENILKDFYETKKKFVDKQDDLIRGVNNKNTQHSDESRISKQEDETGPPKATVANKRNPIVLSYASSRPEQRLQCSAPQKKKDMKNIMSWQSDYNKEYFCRLCNYRGKKKQSISRHTNICSKKFKTKYQNIVKNYCKIKLDKFDQLPNMTSLNDTVVISGEKILQDINSNYFVVYTPKVSKLVENYDPVDISDDDDTVRKKQKITDDMLDSQTGENKIDSIGNKKDEIKEIINGDCIKIDDSSDTASEKNSNSTQSNTNSKNPISSKKIPHTATIQDHTTKIQNIISMCYSKYKKNIDLQKVDKKQPNNPALSKSQLKHKVLSIGRKIINKQGFNCTGLLRYMEHRNLEIVWTSNTSNCSTETNYVRILTKLRTNVVDDDEMGWKTCKIKSKDNYGLCNITSDPPMPKISQIFYNDSSILKVDPKNKLLNKYPVANPKQLPKKTVLIEKHSDLVPAILTHTDPNNEKRITKQKELSKSAYSMPDLNPISVLINNNFINKEATSTEHKENNILTTHNSKNTVESSAGKIKVKPLAELLSKEGPMNTLIIGNPPSCQPSSQAKQPNMFTCINVKDFSQACHVSQPSYVDLVSKAISTSQIVQPSSTAPINHTAQTTYTVQANSAVLPNVIVQMKDVNQTMSSDHTIQPTQTVQQTELQTNKKFAVQSQSSAPSTNAEYAIMDTVELPSTKTNSPIQYLQNLLLIHDIYLLDQKLHELSHMFTCLIKFKVLYKQETMEEPILLSLSLFCLNNKFCMKVKNVNQENIDISKISANWQWEIIKVFTGDVSNKLLQNAQKINRETYEYVKTFLCLLKSINYTKI